MKRSVFMKYKGKEVSINLKPNNFGLTGVIEEVFEDCIRFSTKKETSYIDFDIISTVKPTNRNGETKNSELEVTDDGK